jgi:uncharacterized protein YneF (UPF0154 family)
MSWRQSQDHPRLGQARPNHDPRSVGCSCPSARYSSSRCGTRRGAPCKGRRRGKTRAIRCRPPRSVPLRAGLAAIALISLVAFVALYACGAFLALRTLETTLTVLPRLAAIALRRARAASGMRCEPALELEQVGLDVLLRIDVFPPGGVQTWSYSVVRILPARKAASSNQRRSARTPAART